jgi:pectinesterase
MKKRFTHGLFATLCLVVLAFPGCEIQDEGQNPSVSESDNNSVIDQNVDDPLLAAAAATTRNVPSQYSTVQAAINAAAVGDTIQIAAGTYTGPFTIPSSKSSLTINGASKTGTILTAGAGQTTVTISAADVNFQNITIRNTSQNNTNTNHVMIVYAARCAVRSSYINGWEDTLFVGQGASFYCTGSEIQGAVDFIYGNGRVFITSTTIRQMRSSPTGGTISAPNTDSSQNYGIVFSGCTITSASGVTGGSSYLGRPWGAYGESAFINCSIGSCIASAGWIEFQGTSNSATCRVAEYPCPSGRASWVKRLTSTQAAAYTKSNVLGGWNPN